MKFLMAFVVLLGLSAPARAEAGTYWTGTASLNDETRPLALALEGAEDDLGAHYDLPTLGLVGMPIADVQYDPSARRLTAGHQLDLVREGDRLTGTLRPALMHGAAVSVDLRLSGEPRPLVREREVEFVSRGVTLRGTLVAPKAGGRHPAMVSLHGSGPATRWLSLARARKFAEAGYVTLIFDKAGSGASEGDWTAMSLDDAANDVISAMTFLREQPEVDPEKVGLWGHSQAGWVVSRTAALADWIAFAVVLAGGAVAPAEVERFGYRNRLQDVAATAEQTGRAMALVDLYLGYLASGQGYEPLRAAYAEVRQERWASALGLARVTPAPKFQPKWRWVATYDPVADIRRIRFPVLVMFAEKDRNSPVEGLGLWQANARGAGSSFALVPGADHHFLVKEEGSAWPALAPGYYQRQVEWLNAVVGTNRTD